MGLYSYETLQDILNQNYIASHNTWTKFKSSATRNYQHLEIVTYNQKIHSYIGPNKKS
jgi:hypothetical protein